MVTVAKHHPCFIWRIVTDSSYNHFHASSVLGASSLHKPVPVMHWWLLKDVLCRCEDACVWIYLVFPCCTLKRHMWTWQATNLIQWQGKLRQLGMVTWCSLRRLHSHWVTSVTSSVCPTTEGLGGPSSSTLPPWMAVPEASASDGIAQGFTGPRKPIPPQHGDNPLRRKKANVVRYWICWVYYYREASASKMHVAVSSLLVVWFK